MKWKRYKTKSVESIASESTHSSDNGGPGVAVEVFFQLYLNLFSQRLNLFSISAYFLSQPIFCLSLFSQRYLNLLQRSLRSLRLLVLRILNPLESLRLLSQPLNRARLPKVLEMNSQVLPFRRTHRSVHRRSLYNKGASPVDQYFVVDSGFKDVNPVCQTGSQGLSNLP